MIRFLFIILFFGPASCLAQLYDDFSDGDFSANPVWTGCDTCFQVTAGQLSSKTTSPNSTFHLSTPSTLTTNCQWELSVNLKFSTSGSNYVDIFLASSKADLRNALRGYFIRIGNTQDDICLYRKDSLTITKIIDGIDGRSQTSTTNNTLKIKVIRNASGFTLYDDITGTGNNYILEGTSTDITYITSAYFGISVTQSTASFFQKHFFDDIYAGPIIVDNTPPRLKNLSLSGPQNLLLEFDEDVDQLYAEEVLHYSLNKSIGNPATAVRNSSNHKQVALAFSTAFVNKTDYTLTINNVRDLSANALLNFDTTFSYIIPGYKDIIISEIMADPSPPQNLPDNEYLELYNPTGYTIDLTGWTLSDGGTPAVFPAISILPGSYLIVCSSTSAPSMKKYGNTIGLPDFPSLNNTADKLWLQNGTVLIDYVTYSAQWYKNTTKANGGFSLEIINPFYPCKYTSRNWIASNHIDGGTPGAKNSVYNDTPDHVAPLVKSIRAFDAARLLVVFNEPMDSLSLVSALYSVTGKSLSAISILTNEADSVLLTFAPPFISNPYDSLTLLIQNIKDCWGNGTTFSNYKFTFSIPQAPQYGQLIITEIMADPDPAVALPTDEYIELYNTSDADITLRNSRLCDETDSILLPEIVISPGNYVILCSKNAEAAFTGFGNAYGISSFPSLNNEGEPLYLLNPSLQTVCYVNYTPQWHTDNLKRNGGWSLEMMDTTAFCMGAGNWSSSTDSKGGTPGKANSIYRKVKDRGTFEPLRAYCKDASNALVYFNTAVLPDSLQPANFAVNKGVGNPLFAIPASVDGTVVNLQFAAPLAANTVYTLTVNNQKDCLGKTVSPINIPFGIAEKPATGDLVINELLFNPYTDGFDFVELYNRSEKIIDLKPLLIANADNANGVKDFYAIAPQGFALMPADFLVLTESVAYQNTMYGADAKKCIQLSALPSYSDDEGRCLLIDSSGKRYDQLDYSHNMHFALLDNEDGISLERIDHNRATAEKDNWTSCATMIRATPTRQNSQYLQTRESNTVLSADPETFSPDGDGQHDIINLIYKLDKPGYVGTVKIYNSGGGLVKQLAHNELLAETGTFTWDGLTDEGQRCGIGIYIARFEIYDLAGNLKVYKKAFVLATRL